MLPTVHPAAAHRRRGERSSFSRFNESPMSKMLTYVERNVSKVFYLLASVLLLVMLFFLRQAPPTVDVDHVHLGVNVATHAVNDVKNVIDTIDSIPDVPNIRLPDDRNVSQSETKYPPSSPNGGVADVEKQSKVKEMMRHAWSNYHKYAWGHNELKPISKVPHDGLFGRTLGATIIDSLSTLIIMDMKDEYLTAREWIEESLNFAVPADVSVFETTIRIVGGLLSAYALTKDELHLNKAVDIADRLLPAFETPFGFPNALVNLESGRKHNWQWSACCSLAAEFGTLKLEFDYLSDLTGNPIYRQKIQRIYDHLDTLEKPQNLYPVYVNTNTGKWGQNLVTLGALGDSFYEYLLKAWLMSGKTESKWRNMYDETMTSVMGTLIQKSSPSGFTYLANFQKNRLEHKMDHLACFAGGMFALGANGSSDPTHHFTIGAEITRTCHEGYKQQATGIHPEALRFLPGHDFHGSRPNERYYILRPETVESYFYMWRLTHDQKYRDWGWEIILKLEEHCRKDNGYSGIRDVTVPKPTPDDVQQSFFLAETLKYLYLLFSDDDLISLDDYVFNTEAHPLPIKTRRDNLEPLM